MQAPRIDVVIAGNDGHIGRRPQRFEPGARAANSAGSPRLARSPVTAMWSGACERSICGDPVGHRAEMMPHLPRRQLRYPSPRLAFQCWDREPAMGERCRSEMCAECERRSRHRGPQTSQDLDGGLIPWERQGKNAGEEERRDARNDEREPIASLAFKKIVTHAGSSASGA